MTIVISGVQYSGKWNLQAQAQADAAGTWPKSFLRPMWAIGGYNATKQLGLNDTTNRSSPNQIGSATTWTTLGLSLIHI